MKVKWCAILVFILIFNVNSTLTYINYMITDNYSGANYGHKAENSGKSTNVEYYVQLPNGSQQKVTYKVYRGAVNQQKNSVNFNYSKPPKAFQFKKRLLLKQQNTVS